jgi:hypothetical protein
MRCCRRRLASLLAMAILAATAVPCTSAWAERPSLRDPQDGWFDMSGFLDEAYGFVPLVMPITEPAVGYGAVGALVFIDRNPPVEGRPVRPNIAAVGGLATENGTDGLFAAHLGTWQEGRLHTLLAVADADVNLEFFGLGGDREQDAGQGIDYTVSARGGVAGASYRVGRVSLWLGLRYSRVQTHVALRGDASEATEIPTRDLDLRLAGATPSVTFDSRDNFFTPTQGWYVDLAAPTYREGLGSDRDFELLTLTAMHFRPLNPSLFLGIRAAAKDSSSGTPFYLRPYVSLRGVQALKYQGEQAAEAEAELRWQVHPRWSVVGFGGVGTARSERSGQNREASVGAGGTGFRYLIARTYGLHMGIDVAWGPDEPVLYVVFGTQWMRP